MTLNETLRRAPAFKIEILTAADLDAVSAGGPFSENEYGGDCSCCVSICHSDGNMESGST
jgi:hypothetical protein